MYMIFYKINIIQEKAKYNEVTTVYYGEDEYLDSNPDLVEEYCHIMLDDDIAQGTIDNLREQLYGLRLNIRVSGLPTCKYYKKSL